MHFYRKPLDFCHWRMLPLVISFFSTVLILIYLLRINKISHGSYERGENFDESHQGIILGVSRKLSLPNQTRLSVTLEKMNLLPPRNLDIFPTLANDHIKIVLYVHNRARYLKLVVDSLSRVNGIWETLLIVSHDGYFEEINKIIEGIRFCQVKQIFAPFSPHLFPSSFPGKSQEDCETKDNHAERGCRGNADQYGNYRSPYIVSLKHHWWWMMNTVWDGLQETRNDTGHILFVEEDHYIFPNAYRDIQMLTSLKQEKCRYCFAANLAPSDVKFKGEGQEILIAERIGNVGYAFNRTVWKKIHQHAREFCFFDDYNWDITMWVAVYPTWGTPVYTLRGPRRSAAHFGKCGLHQGQEQEGCVANEELDVFAEEFNKVVHIRPDWGMHVYEYQEGYQAGFRGWGGWGDKRDHQLCLDFAYMYHVSDSS